MQDTRKFTPPVRSSIVTDSTLSSTECLGNKDPNCKLLHPRASKYDERQPEIKYKRRQFIHLHPPVAIWDQT